MKGRLHKTDDGYWKVLYTQHHPKLMVKEYNMSLPLHPKNVIDVEQHIEATRITHNLPPTMDIEWDWCVIVQPDGVGKEYAKLIDVPKLGNEDVPKLGNDVKSGELATFKNDDVREEILCAAVWYKYIPIKKDIPDNVRPVNCNYGLVFCGYRHCHCMYTMVSVTGLRSVESEVGEYVQGFLTNKNRFVDRVEGGIIHRANGNTTDFDDLYSEDLYTISPVPTQQNDVREDDVEKLAEEHITKHHLNHSYNTSKLSFIEGWKKCKENTYTEEEMYLAMGFARGHHRMSDTQFIYSLKK